MNVVAYEGVVEKGQVRLPPDADLPENAKVYVVVPGPTKQGAVRIFSPRLAHPEQAADFVNGFVGRRKAAGWIQSFVQFVEFTLDVTPIASSKRL